MEADALVVAPAFRARLVLVFVLVLLAVLFLVLFFVGDRSEEEAPEAAQALIHTATRNAVDEPGHDLTEREREVLRLMVKGLNNTDIAEQLVVSRSTVKFHVSNILSKLHVTSRTEAVAYALQHNLVR